MDVIEQGFAAILDKIEKQKQQKEEFAKKIKKHDQKLLESMAKLAAPIIADIGLNMLKEGKKDGKGEIFDEMYYDMRMFILGKTDPVPFRPDNIEKTVESQYCIISEEGVFYELMYSVNDVLIDTFLNPLTPDEVLSIYGYDVIFMLYRALHDYMKVDEDLVKSLERTLEFVFSVEERT